MSEGSGKVAVDPAGLSQGGRLSFLLKDSVLYGGAAAVSKAFALLTFPLLARHFTVADYGVLDLFVSIAAAVSLGFIFGQDSAVARYFYEFEDRLLRARMISQSLALQLGCVAVALPLLWIFAEPLTRVMLGQEGRGALFQAMLLQVPSMVVVTFSQNLLKWTFARVRFLILSLGFIAVQAAGLLFAVGVLEVGLEGVLLVGAATSALFACLGLFFIRSWLVAPRGFDHLRVLVPYAAPFGVICVLSALSPTLERTLTIQILGAEPLGLYAAGVKVAMLIALVVNAFQTAWGPFSLAIHKQADAGVTYDWIFRHFAIAVCAATFGLSFLAPALITVLASEKFYGALIVVFPLTLALAVQATSWISEIGIALSKRSHLSLVAYAALLGVTLLGIVALAPVIGLVGVAVAVCLGQIAKAVVASAAAQRAHPLPWTFGPVVALFALAAAYGMGVVWAYSAFGTLAYMVLMAVGVFGSLTLGWFGVLTAADRARIVGLLTLPGARRAFLDQLRGRA